MKYSISFLALSGFLFLSACGTSDLPEDIPETGHYEKSDDLATITVDYPQSKNEQATAQMKTYIEQKVEDFRSTVKKPTGSSENRLTISFDKEERTDGGEAFALISLAEGRGAEEVTEAKTFVFDATGKELSLEDFFQEGFKPLLLQIIQARLFDLISSPDAEWIVQGSTKGDLQFFPEKGGLRFYFTPGQVAPASEGVILLPLPFSELASQGILNDAHLLPDLLGISPSFPSAEGCTWEAKTTINRDFFYWSQRCKNKEETTYYIDFEDGIYRVSSRDPEDMSTLRVLLLSSNSEERKRPEELIPEIYKNLGEEYNPRCLVESLPSFDRNKTRFVVVPELSYQEELEKNSAAPLFPCGKYGQGKDKKVRYFEFHQKENRLLYFQGPREDEIFDIDPESFSFLSEKKVSLNACEQIPDPGRCRAALPRYYFDPIEGRCSEFTWGGCGGLVPFDSRSECQDRCLGGALNKKPDLETFKNVYGVCAPSQKENKRCTREYAPVCGKDKKTYGNACSACAAGVDTYERGECAPEEEEVAVEEGFSRCTAEQKKAETCTQEYIPVCGDNEQTYGNSCSACSTGLIESYQFGECAVGALKEDSLEEEKISIPRGATACLSEQRGPVACTADYTPVCGDDGKTYSNACSACSNDTVNFHVPGECKNDSLEIIASPEEDILGDEEEGNPHRCTDEEKSAQICTLDYTPVCGDDGKTYGNACGACSGGKIDAYELGECPTS